MCVLLVLFLVQYVSANELMMARPGKTNGTLIKAVGKKNCITECVMNCKIELNCTQINFNIRSKICELLTAPIGVIEELYQQDWWTYGKPVVMKDHVKCNDCPCGPGAESCQDIKSDPGFRCICKSTYLGPICDIKATYFTRKCNKSLSHSTLYSNPNDCSLFFSCDGLIPVQKTCSAGQYFDETLQQCNKKEYVLCKDELPICEKSEISYFGNDLKNMIVTPSWLACSQECRKETKCMFWTWLSTLKQCYLKINDNGRRNMAYRISGSRECGKVLESLLSKWTKRTILKDELTLQKNRLFAKIAILGKQYKISFQIKVINPSLSSGEYLSTIHFTIGENSNKYGDRIPGVWLRAGKLHVCTAINGNLNYNFDTGTVPVKEWIQMQVQQVLDSQNRYVFTVLLNDKQIHTTINNKPANFYNIKVYTSDPWYEAASGLIRNLILEQFNE